MSTVLQHDHSNAAIDPRQGFFTYHESFGVVCDPLLKRLLRHLINWMGSIRDGCKLSRDPKEDCWWPVKISAR